jgi:hypothetical protein
MAKSNIYDIVQGIHQAAQSGVDGMLDKDGERKNVGLKRDEGHPILDSRVMDGFAINISANKLNITYQTDVKIKDVHENGFESEIEGMIEKVVSFLKKEYKSLTGNSLSLSPVKKSFQVVAQYVSKVRTSVQARKVYTIGSMDKIDELYGSEHEVDKKFQKFLDQGGWDGKRPDNEKSSVKNKNKKDKEITTIIGDKV